MPGGKVPPPPSPRARAGPAASAAPSAARSAPLPPLPPRRARPAGLGGARRGGAGAGWTIMPPSAPGDSPTRAAWEQQETGGGAAGRGAGTWRGRDLARGAGRGAWRARELGDSMN